MKKIIMYGLVAGLSLFPIVAASAQEKGTGHKTKEFRHEQRQEKQEFTREEQQERHEFHKGLKAVPPQERSEAIRKFHEEQMKERKAFHEKQHQENMAFLKGRLAKNTRLSEAEKEELINSFQNQFNEDVSFRHHHQRENIAFFEQIANNPNLTKEQKKKAIKAHFHHHKEAIKEHRHRHRLEGKDTVPSATSKEPK